MKKLFAFLILVLLGFGIYFFSSYGFQEPAAELTERTTILRIGYSEWPPDLIVYLAQEKGFFEANGLQVELVPVDGFEDLFEKIENKQIDLWPVTLLDAVIAYSEGEEWQIIALEDYSNGADAVLTMEDSGIEGISGLTGKKVGTEQGTVGEFFLQILLQRDGLELSDVEIVDMSYDQIPAALVSGEIDAGVTMNPPSQKPSIKEDAFLQILRRNEEPLLMCIALTVPTLKPTLKAIKNSSFHFWMLQIITMHIPRNPYQSWLKRMGMTLRS